MPAPLTPPDDRELTVEFVPVTSALHAVAPWVDQLPAGIVARWTRGGAAQMRTLVVGRRGAEPVAAAFEVHRPLTAYRKIVDVWAADDVAEQALAMTATYTKERHQFGQPIGAFQAVRQRAADAWIDVQGMQVSLWRAAWLLERGDAVAPSEVRRAALIARAVACECAHRVTSAAQHLHGGMGFDRDYGLYRCYLLAKRWEFVLGGAAATTAALGQWHRDAAQT